MRQITNRNMSHILGAQVKVQHKQTINYWMFNDCLVYVFKMCRFARQIHFNWVKAKCVFPFSSKNAFFSSKDATESMKSSQKPGTNLNIDQFVNGTAAHWIEGRCIKCDFCWSCHMTARLAWVMPKMPERNNNKVYWLGIFTNRMRLTKCNNSAIIRECCKCWCWTFCSWIWRVSMVIDTVTYNVRSCLWNVRLLFSFRMHRIFKCLFSSIEVDCFETLPFFRTVFNEFRWHCAWLGDAFFFVQIVRSWR